MKPQPKVTPGQPDRPEHLTGDERELWDYYAPSLEASRVLTQQDRDTLALFCEARAQIIEIKRLQAEPEYRRIMLTTTVDSYGNEKVKAETNPLDVQRRAWTQIARLCAAELGLSPMSRARVSPGAPEETEDEAESFLRAVR